MTDPYLTRAINDLADMFTSEVVLAECQHLLGSPISSTPSRLHDPATSQLSGARNATHDVGRFSARSRQAQLLKRIQSAGGLTAHEAALRLLGEHGSIPQFEGCRRRVSDLVRAGYVEDSTERRCNPGSPDLSIVWRVTLAGRRALVNLGEDGWSRPAQSAVAS